MASAGKNYQQLHKIYIFPYLSRYLIDSVTTFYFPETRLIQKCRSKSLAKVNKC